MKRILHIIRKEFAQLKRDYRMLPIVFLSPILQLILLGYAANLDVKNIPMLICDADNSQLSRELQTTLLNSGYFTICCIEQDMRRIDSYIINGQAAMALVIPPGFGEKLKAGNSVTVQLLADGSESNSATIGLNYAASLIGWFSRKIAAEKSLLTGFARQELPEPEVRVWYNPDLETRNFMVPGILAMILMMTTMLLTSMAIVREREIGTMEQISVTPIKPVELIIGKLTPFILIALVNVILVVLAGFYLFHIPVKGSIALLFSLSGIFLLSTLGLGLLVSTLSHSQQQAMFAATFFIMLPMIILSGFIFPIENMPHIIQYLTYLMPLRYYFVIVRGLFLKGTDLSTLWDETLILFLLGFGILLLSILRIRKRVK